jgi:hypothetical protein
VAGCRPRPADQRDGGEDDEGEQSHFPQQHDEVQRKHRDQAQDNRHQHVAACRAGCEDCADVGHTPVAGCRRLAGEDRHGDLVSDTTAASNNAHGDGDARGSDEGSRDGAPEVAWLSSHYCRDALRDEEGDQQGQGDHCHQAQVLLPPLLIEARRRTHAELVED